MFKKSLNRIKTLTPRAGGSGKIKTQKMHYVFRLTVTKMTGLPINWKRIELSVVDVTGETTHESVEIVNGSIALNKTIVSEAYLSPKKSNDFIRVILTISKRKLCKLKVNLSTLRDDINAAAGESGQKVIRYESYPMKNEQSDTDFKVLCDWTASFETSEFSGESSDASNAPPSARAPVTTPIILESDHVAFLNSLRIGGKPGGEVSRSFCHLLSLTKLLGPAPVWGKTRGSHMRHNGSHSGAAKSKITCEMNLSEGEIRYLDSIAADGALKLKDRDKAARVMVEWAMTDLAPYWQHLEPLPEHQPDENLDQNSTHTHPTRVEVSGASPFDRGVAIGKILRSSILRMFEHKLKIYSEHHGAVQEWMRISHGLIGTIENHCPVTYAELLGQATSLGGESATAIVHDTFTARQVVAMLACEHEIAMWLADNAPHRQPVKYAKFNECCSSPEEHQQHQQQQNSAAAPSPSEPQGEGGENVLEQGVENTVPEALDLALLPAEGTAFVSVRPGYPVVAGQTWDAHPMVWYDGEFACIIDSTITPPATNPEDSNSTTPISSTAPRREITVTMPGCPALCGMNSSGLSVLSQPIDNGERDVIYGVPTHALIRECLTKSSASEAAQWLRRQPIAVPNTFILIDAVEAIVIEAAPKHCTIVTTASGDIALANHILFDQGMSRNDLNTNSSTRTRFDAMRDLLDNNQAGISVRFGKAAFTQTPLLQTSGRTLLTVLMEPDTFTLHVRFKSHHDPLHFDRLSVAV
eukprot:c10400_g1_i1.p1 GENE.c10400_g1_i1~~c10400_g1_i1.p1  ORF type:complete len:754 (+),score=173.27 c10400_g1_i1:23-2284(+)